ncbi:hypothetical protein COCC4DRAFT_148606 [Bipolaris maydis ATCC 48331]|uniref:Uncharacterized protein n=1 Tax=Cochliobolus heterostrophus (strain C4 / ATCC 48331 / race T) TaxID=665024 RepID=N4WLE5_COCH4|nr:uncharacterized protein COCC4DRAFT_148606 [Bipolaris maydis ATCC 48331]ENI01189.1 hypothetical protein COCC4DRAFT_148606 [Bipolaris maydis ATCC 48331]
MSTRYLQPVYSLAPTYIPESTRRATPLYSFTTYQTDKTTAATTQTHTTTQPTKPPTLPQIDGGFEHHHVHHSTHDPNFAQFSTLSYPRHQHSIQPTLRARNIPIMLSLPVPPPPPPPPLHQQSRPTGNTVHDLLPYCTTEPPLNEAQVIALSDVVGSLRELVPLALAAAAGDKRSLRKLESAVGKRDAVGVVEFFVDEWEIEG